MAVKLMHLPGKPAGVSILKLNGYGIYTLSSARQLVASATATDGQQGRSLRAAC